MKRKREEEVQDDVIQEIIKRVKLCFDRKRKREDDDDDLFSLTSSCKRMKLINEEDERRQYRRDILVYL
jgi:hypothetical protein